MSTGHLTTAVIGTWADWTRRKRPRRRAKRGRGPESSIRTLAVLTALALAVIGVALARTGIEPGATLAVMTGLVCATWVIWSNRDRRQSVRMLTVVSIGIVLAVAANALVEALGGVRLPWVFAGAAGGALAIAWGAKANANQEPSVPNEPMETRREPRLQHRA